MSSNKLAKPLAFSICCPAVIKDAKHTRGFSQETIKSPGFPDSPYPANTLAQWELRGDPDYVLKLTFDSFKLEPNCANDFVRVYDSLVPMDKHLIAE